MADITHDPLASEPKYRNIATGRAFTIGVLAALVTVTIWASWLVSVKMGTRSALTTFDLALMRYGIPAVVLFPFLYRARHLMAQVPKWTLFGIVMGAGVPFFFLSSAGMHYAPVSHAGLLVPGTFPLFVTAIAVLVFKESLSRPRLIGLVSIFIGVMTLLCLSVLSLDGSVWKGDLFFLGASFCWALYTVSLRVAGLPPLAATGLLGLVSTLILITLLLTGTVTSGLGAVSLGVLVWQFVAQALLVGLLTGFTFGFAINSLGAERTAAMGALAPVFASLLAVPLLHEYLGMAAMIGLCFVCFGVVLASGIVKTSR